MPLVAYYPLDEASGDAQDYSGNENNGTINGGVTQDVPGILGTSAYDFDGTDDYIQIPEFNNFSSITQSCWINLDSVNDGDIDILIRLMVNNDIKFLEDGGVIEQTLFDGSSTNTTSVPINQNEWTHLVGTWDGSVAKLYKNGVEEDSTQFTGTIISKNESNNHIGAGISGGNPNAYVDGTISEVRIYDHALTAGEVQYLYEVTQSANFTTNKRLL